MAEFLFLKTIKQNKKTYAEIIKNPKQSFDQPIFGCIKNEISQLQGKNKITFCVVIDGDSYQVIPGKITYFFANTDVKITFIDKPKVIIPQHFIMQWYSIEDIITKVKSISALAEINGINEHSLCSLFIEIDAILSSAKDSSAEINLYNDTNIPQELLEDLYKKRCIKILEENLEDDIAVSQLPFLYEIREKLAAEIEKIDAAITKINEI